MHNSASQYGEAFFKNYVNSHNNPAIIEIGSQDVNGSLRKYAPEGASYIGVDFAPGKSVDLVLEDAYKFPFEDNYADFIVTSSCFEHSEFFWLTFMEAIRVLKPSGAIYINAPSHWVYHRYPTDNWRFYPDAGKALTKYAQREGYNSTLLESFIGRDIDGGRDFVSVIIKDKAFVSSYPNRIFKNIDPKLSPTNIWSHENLNCLCRFDDLGKNFKQSVLQEECSLVGSNQQVCDAS